MLTPFSRITSKASADGFLQLMVECACSVNAVTIMVFQTGMRELQSYRFFYVVSFCDVKCPVALLRRTGRDGLGFFTQCCLHCFEQEADCYGNPQSHILQLPKFFLWSS